jgi:hypothetical protein
MKHIINYIQLEHYTDFPGKLIANCDVARSGKSAIAHTVTQQCRTKGMLTSFFFDQEISGRNRPQTLFSTIMWDLAGLNRVLAKDIVEEDCSIASASLTRQFEELILKLSSQYTFTKPAVIVIDALDEADKGQSSEIFTELLDIFCNQVPNLPGMFRIFLTSWPKREFDKIQSQHDHVRLQ